MSTTIAKLRQKSILLALIVPLLLSMQGPIMAKFFLDLQEVTVIEMPGLIEPQVTATRAIKRNFFGSFRADVRKVDDDIFVCLGLRSEERQKDRDDEK